MNSWQTRLNAGALYSEVKVQVHTAAESIDTNKKNFKNYKQEKGLTK